MTDNFDLDDVMHQVFLFELYALMKAQGVRRIGDSFYVNLLNVSDGFLPWVTGCGLAFRISSEVTLVLKMKCNITFDDIEDMTKMLQL